MAPSSGRHRVARTTLWRIRGSAGVSHHVATPSSVNGTLRGAGTDCDPSGRLVPRLTIRPSLLILAALDHDPGGVPGDLLIGTQRQSPLNRRRPTWLLQLLDVHPSSHRRWHTIN